MTGYDQEPHYKQPVFSRAQVSTAVSVRYTAVSVRPRRGKPPRRLAVTSKRTRYAPGNIAHRHASPGVQLTNARPGRVGSARARRGQASSGVTGPGPPAFCAIKLPPSVRQSGKLLLVDESSAQVMSGSALNSFLGWQPPVYTSVIVTGQRAVTFDEDG